MFCCCIGALFPVFANRNKGLGIPGWVFFFVKFFGSGVIVATAFIHVSSVPGGKLVSMDGYQGYCWMEAFLTSPSDSHREELLLEPASPHSGSTLITRAYIRFWPVLHASEELTLFPS
jgi:hypothetical protein